ncbi:MAG: hypothetical protein UHO63_09965 [Blautia sp.]|nr:hypothetical protein [Blautia sp.]
MSKFLKVIVNLVVLFSIVVAAALLVPPFAGIDTVMNDNTNTETNIPVGSVAYGKEIKVKELKKKDRIIYSEGSSTYVYEITDMDASAGAYEVKDPYSKSSEAEVVTLQKSVPKVAVVVPFIGYAAIALQSKEGLIVIGLGIVLLIILFILSELWRKDDDDDDEDDEEEDNEDDEDDDEDDEEEMSRKERRRLKKEEKRRRKEEKRRLKEAEEDEEYEEDDDEDEEEELSRKERRRLKKEEKRRRKLAKKGLLEDEDEEEESSETEIAEPVSLDEGQQHEELQGFDEAMKEAMSSIALGVSQVNASENIEQEAVPETESAKEADIEGTEPEMPEEIPAADVPEAAEDIQSENLFEMQEEISDEPKVDVNAVPKMPSLEELLAKAEAAGEKPEVKKDKENEVTLLDYSDIL